MTIFNQFSIKRSKWCRPQYPGERDTHVSGAFELLEHEFLKLETIRPSTPLRLPARHAIGPIVRGANERRRFPSARVGGVLGKGAFQLDRHQWPVDLHNEGGLSQSLFDGAQTTTGSHVPMPHSGHFRRVR